MTDVERDALNAETEKLRARQEARSKRLAALDVEMAALRKRHEEIHDEIGAHRHDIEQDKSEVSLDERIKRSIARDIKLDALDADLETLGARHAAIKVELDTDQDEQIRDERRSDEIYAILAIDANDRIAESDRKILEIERELGLKPRHIPNLPS